MGLLNILWLLVQLVGYCIAFSAVLGASLCLILAPPFFFGRAIWRHYA